MFNKMDRAKQNMCFRLCVVVVVVVVAIDKKLIYKEVLSS